jgi:phage terminase large subunit-like protein
VGREVTLGGYAAWWIEHYLCHGPGDVRGQPLVLTGAQRTFLDKVYTFVESPHGWRRKYRRAFLSRPKGWAKSELAGAIVCFEALGECRIGQDDEPHRIVEPLVKCLATEEGQAGNTYDNVRVMLTEGRAAEFGCDVGLTRTFLPGGGEIRPATSGAASKDGGKETFVVADETHLMTLPEHRSMFDTVRRNLPKRKAADPWMLETSTMYRQGAGSVAEDTHRYAKAIVDGKVRDAGLLFDHQAGDEDFDFSDDAQLLAQLQKAYGEADWVDLERLVDEARDPQTAESDFRRYYLNQAVASAERWVPEGAWDALRSSESLSDGDRVALGFDGSEGTERADWQADSTALVACRLSDGLLVPLGIWEHTIEGPWEPPRDEVDAQVRWAFDTFDVVRMHCDRRGWEQHVDSWAGEFGSKRVFFVPNSPKRQTDQINGFESALRGRTIAHNGDGDLRRHVLNARCDVRSTGQSEFKRLGKPAQPDKIDLAVASLLAVEARGDAIANGAMQQQESGFYVW